MQNVFDQGACIVFQAVIRNFWYLCAKDHALKRYNIYNGCNLKDNARHSSLKGGGSERK